MKLRDYQEKAVQAVLEAFRKIRKVLIVLPTGCGKTVVFAEIIRRLMSDPANDGKQALVLAHRQELVFQAEEKINAIAECSVDVEMGERRINEFKALQPRVIVSSTQTQGRRLGKFDPKQFMFVCIDEAHHSTADSYTKCVAHYLSNPDCRLLGVTATPHRADEAALGKVYEKCVYEYSIGEAIRDGWLVPITQKLIRVDSIDFNNLPEVARDFNLGELGKVMEEEKALHAVAIPTLQEIGNRRAIVFATTVKQAERLCEIFNRYFVDRKIAGSADFVSGRTDRAIRKQKLEAFQAGKTQIMVNVGVLTEGFDDPGVSVIVMARPTKSQALYIQMVGRGTRPAAEIAGKLGEVGTVTGDATEVASTVDAASAASPASARRALIANSAKPSCLVLDFVGNSSCDKLVSATDVLGGKDPDDVKRRAKEKLLKKAGDVDEALRLSREEIAAEKKKAAEEAKAREEATRRERAFIMAAAKYSSKTVDPLLLYDVNPVDPGMGTIIGPKDLTRLSEKQCNLLRMHIGVNPDKVTPANGKRIIDQYFRRISKGRASLKQIKYCHRLGILFPMDFEETRRTLDIISSRGFWKEEK